MAVNYQEAAEFISNDLRLKTLPVAAKFLKEKAGFPEKTRQPSVVFKKTGDYLHGRHHGPGLRLDGGIDPGRPDLRPRHDHVRLH